jgi:hypothetical protein
MNTTTNMRDHARAIRYRQLALREPDKSKAALLNLIADEAERGVLVTSDIHRSAEKPVTVSQPSLG